MRSVKLGRTSGAFVVVESGLKPGERIVVDGIDKAKQHAGQPVTTKPADTSALPMGNAEKGPPAPPTPSSSPRQGVAAPQPSGSAVPTPSPSTAPSPR
jgi:hypothetical protein